MKEHVVLVDLNNNQIGLEDKYVVHTGNTPLHRGFSLFLFNPNGQLLLQQRSKYKITWPNVWSNSVCGHPAHNETPQQAAVRRLQQELNITLPITDIHIMLPNYQYKYSHHGIVENEICPVMVVFADSKPNPNPQEVQATRWVDWDDFIKEIQQANNYSEWCVEETRLLTQSNRFIDLYQQNTTNL